MEESKMNTTEEKPKEQSRYNEALLNIERLHHLWVRIEKLMYEPEEFQGHYLRKWHSLLDSVWRELRADVERQPDKENLIERNNEFRKQFVKSKTHGEKYNVLNARHEFLKILQDKAGKGGSYSDGTETDFE